MPPPSIDSDWSDFLLVSTNDEAIDANNRILKREIRILKLRLKILEDALITLVVNLKVKDHKDRLKNLGKKLEEAGKYGL